MSVLELSQREEDDRKFKDLASFKAQFPTILASKPFVPAKSKRLLTGNLTAERERQILVVFLWQPKAGLGNATHSHKINTEINVIHY